MPPVFSPALQAEAWPYRFAGQLRVSNIAGGTPTDQKVAEGWLKAKAGITDEKEIQRAAAQIMVERGVSPDEAIQLVNTDRHLNGFKRMPLPDGRTQLYLDARCLKAALKEAASVALAADKLAARGWGKTNKGLLSFVPEHIFVMEQELLFTDADGNPITEPTETVQRFVHTFRGSGIQYEEVVAEAFVDFTVHADYDFTEKDWAMIWLTGQLQGLGASRSQGYGVYEVTRWEKTSLKAGK